LKLLTIEVAGFRSLAAVGPIPVRRPTILAGHNDSGKSSVLDAVALLLGSHPMNPDDATFVDPEQGTSGEEDSRVSVTSLIGEFELSASEQAALALPGRIRIRRIFENGTSNSHEIEMAVPVDNQLHDLPSKTVAILKQIASERSVVIPAGALKPVIVEKITEYALTEPQTQGWIACRRDIKDALPQLLRFGDGESAEMAVKAALNSRYREHLASEELRQQVRDLESELRDRICVDAEDLVKHIKQRCPDLVTVNVDPDVSFTGGLQRTRLKLARKDGEEVSLASAGSGRMRRISLAIWEWTSEILNDSGKESKGEISKQDLVIVYDEPDTHLDYLQQRRVMRLIREQCDIPGVAMLIATHSMNLIDGAAIEDIVHLRLRNERTVVEGLLDHDRADAGARKHLSDIAAALGLRNTVLLHERCFVGVEGATEQQAFPILFRVATGRSLPACGIVIVACNNNEGALNFVGFLARTGRQTMLIVDADSKKSKLFSDTRLVAAGLKPDEHLRLIGSPDKEIEFVFTDRQWMAVANDVWPRNDDREWTEEDFAALREESKFSSALYDSLANASDTGPTSKTSLVYELSRTLVSADELPKELLHAFEDLEKLAALDA